VILGLFQLRRPTVAEMRAAVEANAGAAFSYDDVGATRTSPPVGWTVDEERVVLGRGEEVWRRAVDAIRRWRQFGMPWIALLDSAPPAAGDTVAFASNQVGVWVINVCRVVYVDDDTDGPVWRYGFAYGTLETHAVRGEEQFRVEWDRASDVVTFRVYKFSRPKHPLIKAALPLARKVQGDFTRGAQDAMREAVRG
jgi:uncharacterized protein (UPF0548 family)